MFRESPGPPLTKSSFFRKTSSVPVPGGHIQESVMTGKRTRLGKLQAGSRGSAYCRANRKEFRD